MDNSIYQIYRYLLFKVVGLFINPLDCIKYDNWKVVFMQLIIAAWLRSWDLFRVRDKIKD